MSTRDPASLIGRNLGGRFRLDALIAQHPYGVTYDAHDLHSGRSVTVRLLIGTGALGPEFEREARRLRALRDPLIARLHASVRLADGTAGLVMEPMIGETLRDRLTRGVFRVDEALHTLDELLRALEICHLAGIMHRDIRPENILLRYENHPAEPTVKLHGAGLAQLVAHRAGAGGMLYGHPLFTAPEQWVNRAVDPRADLYAIALLGHVMLLGRHFIDPGTPLEVCRRHFKAPRPPLHFTARNEPIPPSLAQALTRSAAPRPEDRFPTAEAMRAAITAARVELPSRPPLPRMNTGPMPALITGPTRPIHLEDDDLRRMSAELAAALDD